MNAEATRAAPHLDQVVELLEEVHLAGATLESIRSFTKKAVDPDAYEADLVRFLETRGRR